MALLTCPECGHNVSDQAKMFPGCGYPASKILAAAQPAPEQTAWEQPEQKRQLESKARRPAVQPGAPSQPESYALSAMRALAVIAALFFMFAAVFPEMSSKIIKEVLHSAPASQASKPSDEISELVDSVISELEDVPKDNSEADEETEQKRKARARAEINELRQYFRSDMDKVENIKWISHKKTPKFFRNKSLSTLTEPNTA